MNHSSTKSIYIGKIIRRKVDESGMTYAEFARRINSSRTSLYSLFESKSIDVEKLICISNVLNCNLFYEVYGIGSKPMNDYPFIAIPIKDGKLDISNLGDEYLQRLRKCLYDNKGLD